LQIHLAQLPYLDTSIPTTLSRSSPSSLSISNVTRPFPSSRSFLHLPHAQGHGPGPPSSTITTANNDNSSPASSGTERHRDAFDRERAQENTGASLAALSSATDTATSGPRTQKNVEHAMHANSDSLNVGSASSSASGSKPSRRRLFSEHDVQTIARNASALLALHETFVKRLKYALEPLGFGDVFVAGAKDGHGQQGTEGVEVERAVEAVSELFCQHVRVFFFFFFFVVSLD
jgi:hypothetical protein